ncbi:MAG: exosortase/archaeosortase family protein [Acidobacteria bacterium]|nr:exosortase/archaeosortase family protein [Acidobacteriota bacterium]
MSSAIPSPVTVDTRRTAAWRLWLPFALFSVLWIDLCRQLSYTWENREQYSYGWFVPFFALYLFWHRWRDRPAPAYANSSYSASNGGRDGVRCPWLLPFSTFVLALLLLPLRVIHEVNPDWPLITWPYALIVVGLTMRVFHVAGGWSWVKHFVFPISFILVAIAWPYRIEKGLTQNLMQVVANITVELLGLVGVPALQRGNLIEVGTGVVGVDEACSGVRSFQSTFMVSLFMGELYRLRIWTRIGFLACGLLLAFGFNVVRTLFLSWQANHELAAIEKWHDSAGMTISVVCFFSLWLLAIWVRSRWPDVSLRLNPLPFNLKPSTRLRSYFVLIGCWAVAAIGGTEIWYRAHDNHDGGGFSWTVSFPTNSPSYRQIELTERTRRALRHDAGVTGSWTEHNGSKWSVYFFRWNPKSIQSVILARGHRPEVCLPAAGLRQLSKSGLEWFEAGNLELPFHKYVFESAGRTVFVFFCLWQDSQDQQKGMRTLQQSDRWEWVRTGRRNLGQQTLEIILTGYDSLEQAEQELRKRLPILIRVERSQDPTGKAYRLKQRS